MIIQFEYYIIAYYFYPTPSHTFICRDTSQGCKSANADMIFRWGILLENHMSTYTMIIEIFVLRPALNTSNSTTTVSVIMFPTTTIFATSVISTDVGYIDMMWVVASSLSW